MKKLNIIIPAAGEGQRFVDQGYKQPKPMIDVDGVPMIQRVINNLRPPIPHKYILIQQKKHAIPRTVFGDSESEQVYLTEKTDGAIDTILIGIDKAYVDGPILLANCDQLADFSVNDFINSDVARIMTFISSNPHHSYVTTTKNRVNNIVEKEVISNQAVFGLYYFPHTSDFISSCLRVVDNDTRVNNEHYVSSALKIMIDRGVPVETYQIPNSAKHILGTPEELEQYLSHLDRSRKYGI